MVSLLFFLLLFLLLFFPPIKTPKNTLSIPKLHSPSPYTGCPIGSRFQPRRTLRKVAEASVGSYDFIPFPSHKARAPCAGWKNRLTFDTEKYSSRIYALSEGEERRGEGRRGRDPLIIRGKGDECRSSGSARGGQDTRRTRVIVIGILDRHLWSD